MIENLLSVFYGVFFNIKKSNAFHQLSACHILASYNNVTIQKCITLKCQVTWDNLIFMT